MKKNLNYNKTIYACFIGYIVQAVVNNFVPLLFLTFEKGLSIPLSKITLLVTVNFAVQLLVDLLSARYVDKLGYRKSIVLAHIFCAAGLIFLTILPAVIGDAFAGILISVIIYAIGGGIIEVLISPIVESCPTDNKEKTMSILHSFYCWGHMAVVLISTVFFKVFGIDNWRILAVIWASLPLANAIIFIFVPIAPLLKEDEKSMSLKELFSKKLFWVLFVMMLCAGASEQAVSQWASTFAELGLGVSKAIGDLAGPMSFAVMMGISRAVYGKWGDRIKLDSFMVVSAVICVISYLCISLFKSPAVCLIGCGICGLSVGIMWPGSISKASSAIRTGGTAMFALLALAGDVGCSVGPSIVGFISGAFNDNLKLGILSAIGFPLLFTIGIIVCNKIIKNRKKA
ncbi:MAG: MFS transporter [Eubacterium sp.]|nr:MFS transporter [Eubacterium sp.]